MHRRHHLIGCLVAGAVVALVLVAVGAPVGAFAFVVFCPLMMLAMMFFMGSAMRPRDRADKL